MSPRARFPLGLNWETQPTSEWAQVLRKNIEHPFNHVYQTTINVDKKLTAVRRDTQKNCHHVLASDPFFSSSTEFSGSLEFNACMELRIHGKGHKRCAAVQGHKRCPDHPSSTLQRQKKKQYRFQNNRKPARRGLAVGHYRLHLVCCHQSSTVGRFWPGARLPGLWHSSPRQSTPAALAPATSSAVPWAASSAP